MSIVVEPEHVRAAAKRQIAIVRKMTPAQRLAQASRMNQSMRELLAAGFRMRQPEWNDTQIAAAVADRILHAATG